MDVHYVSEIAEADFAAWQHILFGLPDTYAAWRWYFKHDLVEAGLGGHQVVPVQVQPSEYLSYCKSRGAAPDMESFRNFGKAKSDSGSDAG